MAEPTSGPDLQPVDASGLRLAIVAAEFNREVTAALVEGALEWLESSGVPRPQVPVHWVPGAFELPLACKVLAESGRYDALVALGCVIRGETAHFAYVAGQASEGIMAVMLETGVPIGFGVLTTEDEAQARARAGGSRGNKGVDAAVSAVRMALLDQDILKG